MTLHVTMLNGGFFGIDGTLFCQGMLALKTRIEQRFGVGVMLYDWAFWQRAEASFKTRSLKAAGKRTILKRAEGLLKAQAAAGGVNVVVAYSGGVSRLTWMDDPPIDELICYDPSPRWQMEPIGPSIKRAITYQNPQATMLSFYGWLGGGVLTAKPGGPVIERILTKRNHFTVQWDESLHQITLQRIAALRG